MRRKIEIQLPIEFAKDGRKIDDTFEKVIKATSGIPANFVLIGCFLRIWDLMVQFPEVTYLFQDLLDRNSQMDLLEQQASSQSKPNIFGNIQGEA